MRIVLIGQAAFGEKVLQAIFEIGEQVVGVFCPPDSPERPSALKQLAQASGIPVFQPPKMREDTVFEQYTHLRPELTVMAFVTDIIPERFLTYPVLGTIQYHPSLLPRHRGGSAINWTVINGESQTGITIFWPDKGIDTGPILLQKTIDIDPDETTGSLYFNKLFPLGVEAIVEAVQLVSQGKAPRIEQDESLATYEPLCTAELAQINWRQPVDQVYNLIRGCNPQPGAEAGFRGSNIKIFDCQKEELLQETIPGNIWWVGEDHFSVGAQGGSIRVKRLQPKGEGKIKAAEFITAYKLHAGEKFEF